ncbi:MAG: hydroxyacid dehydrogenase [Candidatus Kryptonium sp.]
MKILITDPIEESCVNILRNEGFEVDLKPGISKDELKSIINNYVVLIVRSGTKVTADIINEARNLKIIGRAGAGVDNIDVDAATRRGIIVMNTPGGNTISTAEHTMSLILALARNIPQACNDLKAGNWNRKKFIGVELFGKTIGIIGLGRIGREVAVRCKAFGMNVIGYDPVLSSEIAMKLGIEIVSDINEIYRRSDFITVHVPLNDETRGMIGKNELAKCKRGVRIINCARGGIIDEVALLEAIESGHVAGAALDVF